MDTIFFFIYDVNNIYIEDGYEAKVNLVLSNYDIAK